GSTTSPSASPRRFDSRSGSRGRPSRSPRHTPHAIRRPPATQPSDYPLAAIVAGGILAATGVILVLTDRRPQTKPNTGGAPWVGAGLLAAGATGALVGARGGF